MIKFIQNATRVAIRAIVFTLFILVFVALFEHQFPTFVSTWNDVNTKYLIALSVIAAIWYLANFQSVNRTLRRLIYRQRAIILGLSIIFMYIVAVFNLPLPFGLGTHQVLWGYTASMLYVLLWLRLIAVFAAPVNGRSAESELVADTPDVPTKVLTKTQHAVYAPLREIVAYDMAVSVALTGSWGTGKTKILSQLESTHPDLLWFKFYPWAYTTEESLVEDFYVQLLHTINRRYPTLRLSGKTITPNVKRIIDSAAGKGALGTLASIALEWFNDGKSPEQKISDILQVENIRVIVVIDDVERISDPEIINRTLQLAHYVKKMYGAKLIMSFERDVILQALPLHVKNGDEYLEKFFEIELTLHTPFQSDIESQLLAYIPMGLQPSYISKALLKDIGSHRAIIRLANEYKMIERNSGGASLAGMINPDDLVLMLHLKLKYPALYSDIRDHPNIYTQPGGEDDVESIEFYMEDKEKRTQRIRDHIMRVISSAPSTKQQVVINHLTTLFPFVAKPLTGLQGKSTDRDVLRKERRIGLRLVLDGYFSASNRLDKIIAHEKRAHQLIEILNQSYTKNQLIEATDSFVTYCNAILGEGWDAPLYILMNELEDSDLENDVIMDISRALMISGLKLGPAYDRQRKVRIVEQAFYIFVDQLLYKVSDTEKEHLIDQMKFVDILKSSKTPMGSLLLVKMNFSSEAAQVKALLNENTKERLRLATRRHHEEYYIALGSDIVAETDDRYRHYIEQGWREVIGNYRKGMATYREWLQSMQIKYPSAYLRPYVMKTHRGNWAFREEDQGASRVAKDITSTRLNELVELIKVIHTSPQLTADDNDAIQMVQEYINRH